MSKPTVVFTAPRITSGFMEDDIRLLKPYVNICKLANVLNALVLNVIPISPKLWRMLYEIVHCPGCFCLFCRR